MYINIYRSQIEVGDWSVANLSVNKICTTYLMSTTHGNTINKNALLLIWCTDELMREHLFIQFYFNQKQYNFYITPLFTITLHFFYVYKFVNAHTI